MLLPPSLLFWVDVAFLCFLAVVLPFSRVSYFSKSVEAHVCAHAQGVMAESTKVTRSSHSSRLSVCTCVPHRPGMRRVSLCVGSLSCPPTRLSGWTLLTVFRVCTFGFVLYGATLSRCVFIFCSIMRLIADCLSRPPLAILAQVLSLVKSLCHLRHRSTLRTWLLTSLWRSLQRWPDSTLRRLLWFARYTARFSRRWMIRRTSPVRPVPLEIRPCLQRGKLHQPR